MGGGAFTYERGTPVGYTVKGAQACFETYGFSVQGLASRGVGVGAYDSEFALCFVRCGDQGLGIRVEGLELRVQGSGLSA